MLIHFSFITIFGDTFEGVVHVGDTPWVVVGFFIDLTIVNHQAHSTGYKLSNKITGTTMRRVLPMFIFLGEISMDTLVDLALDDVDLVLRCWVGAKYH